MKAIALLKRQRRRTPSRWTVASHRVGPAILAAGLLSFLAACSGPERELDAEGSSEPEARQGFVEAEVDVQLFYQLVGTGPDTMVVIHGGPGFSMDYFRADLEPLGDSLTLIFYDQRGTGRSTLVSDSAHLAASWFAEDLDAVRSHFGLERLSLLGHSWGAGVAALYAMQYPARVDRMLIVGGVPLHQELLTTGFETMQANRDSSEIRRMEELFEDRLADPGDVEACRAYYVLWFRPFFADSSAADLSRGDFCAGTAEARRNKMENVDRFTSASLGDWDWRDSLRDMSAPTLVIHGTADPIPADAAREWAATLPNARLLLMDGVGHFLYLEAPDRFFPAVREFAAGGWPEAASQPADSL